MSLRAVIPGPPQPQQRARIVRRGSHPAMIDPPASKLWKAHAEGYMIEAMRARAGSVGPRACLQGPVAVEILAVFPLPKSLHRKTAQRGRAWHTTNRGDLDNIVKAVLDAMTRVWILDDRQVAQLFATKLVGAQEEAPRVEVVMRRLPPGRIVETPRGM